MSIIRRTDEVRTSLSSRRMSSNVVVDCRLSDVSAWLMTLWVSLKYDNDGLAGGLSLGIAINLGWGVGVGGRRE